jgi:hypothetical protein
MGSARALPPNTHQLRHRRPKSHAIAPRENQGQEQRGSQMHDKQLMPHCGEPMAKTRPQNLLQPVTSAMGGDPAASRSPDRTNWSLNHLSGLISLILYSLIISSLLVIANLR